MKTSPYWIEATQGEIYPPPGDDIEIVERKEPQRNPRALP